MQNKAKVKVGKMHISVAVTKNYDKNNEQSATNVIQNKAKQSQDFIWRKKLHWRENF